MPPIAILTYHSIDDSGSVVSMSPADFEDQMSCLANQGIRGISLREAVSYHDRTGFWPGSSVVLTFDDGFANFYDAGLPLLLRYGFNATVFVVTGYMGEFNVWERPPAGLGRRRILSWPQAAELASLGFEIGSHTHTHPDLARLTTGEAEREIVYSREQIGDRLAGQVESFAYPYGSLGSSASEIVRREFRSACTTSLKRANGDQLHSLPRIDMCYIGSRYTLERLVSGRLDRYLAVRRLGRSVRGALHSHLQLGQ